MISTNYESDINGGTDVLQGALGNDFLANKNNCQLHQNIIPIKCWHKIVRTGFAMQSGTNIKGEYWIFSVCQSKRFQTAGKHNLDQCLNKRFTFQCKLQAGEKQKLFSILRNYPSTMLQHQTLTILKLFAERRYTDIVDIYTNQCTEDILKLDNITIANIADSFWRVKKFQKAVEIYRETLTSKYSQFLETRWHNFIMKEINFDMGVWFKDSDKRFRVDALQVRWFKNKGFSLVAKKDLAAENRIYCEVLMSVPPFEIQQFNELGCTICGYVNKNGNWNCPQCSAVVCSDTCRKLAEKIHPEECTAAEGSLSEYRGLINTLPMTRDPLLAKLILGVARCIMAQDSLYNKYFAFFTPLIYGGMKDDIALSFSMLPKSTQIDHDEQIWRQWCGVWNRTNMNGRISFATSFCNHSCDPNVEVLFAPSPGGLVLCMNRDIKCGEEITCDYAKYLSFDSHSEKRSYLNTQFGFLCECDKCSEQ